ncbi:MAG: molybdopterin-binding protein [Deltaproteobacteria bacterium]|jgi:molybdenum cofactor synthesis domain-containing protein|nr:molybdopterin-binding protein [Deltaproteobacteria bacterium]
MKTIKTEDAVGSALCHDLTRIVRDEVKETIFRKGHVVRAEDVEVLLSMGKRRLYVLDIGADLAHENEAAELLAESCNFKDRFLLSEAKEGRINVSAKEDGLFLVNVSLLEEVNDEDEIGVAVRQSGVQVKKGEILAGLKIVPLAIARAKLDRVREVVGSEPLMEVRAYLPLKAAIVATGSEIYHKRIEDAFTPVVEEKLLEYGVRTVKKTVCDDDTQEIAKAVKESLEIGAEIIICTGGMSVDPDDLTPGAIKASGAEIVTYGAPALPGAMFLTAYLGEVPVLGLPGCVMFGKKTIFDIVMPRIAAGLKITRRQIRRLGHGGLCLSCPVCIFPGCGFGRGWPFSLADL